MSKQEMKKIINREFGFCTTKIILLEATKNSFGEYDYIMFEVCGVEYQMNYDYCKKAYTLHIYSSDRTF